MVRAIIIDVDGVIVGKKKGVNFPLPNADTIEALKDLQRKGIPVVLCTAKFNYAVREIIVQADLRNPHITDGGALIIDPLDDKVIKKNVFDKSLALAIVAELIAEGFYTEVYGVDNYYLQKDHVGEFTEKRIRILQKEHKVVNLLQKQIESMEVIKIIAFSHNDKDKQEITRTLHNFESQTHMVWSLHPSTLPSENIVITAKGVSKKNAALEVLHYLNISLDQTLGVGDTMGDWKFMSLCKYVGVVGDESQELKDLAKTKREGNYYFGSSVDEDGFLQILNYFIK